jgi:hypothetical protein
VINEVLAEYAEANARQFDDRENTVGSSEIGQCARKVFYTKNAGDRVYGVDSDEDYVAGWGAALRGTLFENFFWMPAMRARYGDNLKFAGKEQQTFILEFLSATPDGLVINQPRNAFAEFGIDDISTGGCFVTEAKTIDSRIKLVEPRPEHVFQIHVQIGLIRELTPYRPEYGVISYANASFLDDVIEFAVHFDPKVFEHAKRRAALIMTARQADELKAEGWITGGKECEHCPYTHACNTIRHDVPNRPPQEPLDPQFIAEISDLGNEVKDRRATLKTATEELRDIEHDIRERLRAKGVREITGDGIVVSWTSVKGRPSYDWKGIREAAAQAGVDLDAYVTVGDMSSRLDVRATRKSQQKI